MSQFAGLRRPEVLSTGSNIRVVSPAFPSIAFASHRRFRAEKALRSLGYRVSYGAHTFKTSTSGELVNLASERAEDLMEAFADPSVDAIMAADAGLGSRDVVELLDTQMISTNLKPFIGYCDNVYLNQYLASCVKATSFYGCTFMEHFGEAGSPFPETVEYFEAALTNRDPISYRPVGARTRDRFNWYESTADHERERNLAGGWTWLRTGHGRGPLLGGEISLIPDVLRMFDVSLESAVLFWDVAATNKKSIKDQICALGKCAGFDALAGMVVGAHPKLDLDVWAELARQALGEILPPGSEYPIVINVDLSHLAPPMVVPYADEMCLDSDLGLMSPRNHEVSPEY